MVEKVPQVVRGGVQEDTLESLAKGSGRAHDFVGYSKSIAARRRAHHLARWADTSREPLANSKERGGKHGRELRFVAVLRLPVL